MSGALYLAVGLLAGALQVRSLAHSVRGRGIRPFSLLARMLGVSAVLLLSARAGCLRCGAEGWSAGFCGLCLYESRRWR